MKASGHAGRWALGLWLLACAGDDPGSVAEPTSAPTPEARPVTKGGGEAEPTPAQWGERRYAAVCASCHGPAARGDGPRAGSLDPVPVDLTRIAARRGGSFDVDVVSSYIDGRRPLESHAPSSMPVWGGERGDPDAPKLTEERRLSPVAIRQIVEYLRTIQR